jgi:hypothetical protein
MWAGRLAALLVAVVIPACNSTAGPGSNKGPNLLWNSQAGSGITSSTGSAVTWVDPNTGLGGGTIGVVQIISSVDDATYAQFNVSTQPPPFNQWVAYIFAVNHPLSTDTSSTTITSKESELLGFINGYRNMVMGNRVGAGGGAIIVGGGSVVLPSFLTGTKCARAHCKHYAYFHNQSGNGMPGEGIWDTHPPCAANGGIPGGPWIIKGLTTLTPNAAPPTNFEGDHVIFTLKNSAADQTTNPGMVTPLRPGMLPYNRYANQGRLGKLMVDTAPAAGEFSYSDPDPNLFSMSINVRDQMVNDDALLIVDFFGTNLFPYPPSSHICVGYWTGGPRTHYWNILFIKNPNPAN